MVVGILTVELRIPESLSLKDKRVVLKSIKDKIRSKFNVSIAEIDGQDKWQKSALGVAYVGNNKVHADQALSKIVDFIKESRQADLIDYNTELL